MALIQKISRRGSSGSSGSVGGVSRPNEHAELLRLRRDEREAMEKEAMEKEAMGKEAMEKESNLANFDDVDRLGERFNEELEQINCKLERITDQVSVCLDGLGNLAQQQADIMGAFAELKGCVTPIFPSHRPSVTNKRPSYRPVIDVPQEEAALPVSHRGPLSPPRPVVGVPEEEVALPVSPRGPLSPYWPVVDVPEEEVALPVSPGGALSLAGDEAPATTMAKPPARRAPHVPEEPALPASPRGPVSLAGDEAPATTMVKPPARKVPWMMPLSKSRSGLSSNSNESAHLEVFRSQDDSEAARLEAAKQRHCSMGSGHSDLMKELFLTLSRVRHRTSLQKSVWLFLEDPDLVWGGRLFMRLLSLLILVSAIIPVVQTVNPPPLDPVASTILEIALDVVFALEVVVRFYTCPNRVMFSFDFCNFIDMLAIALVIVMRAGSNASLLQADAEGHALLVYMICGLPVLRLLKLLRRFETFHLILRAFRLASEALPVLIFILAVLVLVFASMIYIFEPRENIESMPRSLWLTIVTVGTIGYGDVVPQSTPGTITVALLVVVSALYMAIPIGIVGNAFSTVWHDRDRLLLIDKTRSRFLSSGYKASDVPAMFFSFDTDGDGNLSLDEFLSMMHKLQINMSGPRLVDLFQSFDVDASGFIDDHEFVQHLFPNAYVEIYRQPLPELPEPTAVANSEPSTPRQSSPAQMRSSQERRGSG